MFREGKISPMFREGKLGLLFAPPTPPCAADACRAAAAARLALRRRRAGDDDDDDEFNIDGTGLPPQRLAAREPAGWARLRRFQSHIAALEVAYGGFTFYQQRILRGFLEVRLPALFGADMEAARAELCRLCGVPALRRYMFVVAPRQVGKTKTIMRALGAFAALGLPDSVAMFHLRLPTAEKDIHDLAESALACNPAIVRRNGSSKHSARLVHPGGIETDVQAETLTQKNVSRTFIFDVRPLQRARRALPPLLPRRRPPRRRRSVRAARAVCGARGVAGPGRVRALGPVGRGPRRVADRRVRPAALRAGAARRVGRAGRARHRPVAVVLLMDAEFIFMLRRRSFRGGGVGALSFAAKLGYPAVKGDLVRL